MNQYQCPACGQTSYSAAREADMIDPSCPYCAHNKAAPVSKTETAKPETTTDYTTLPRAMRHGYTCDNCGQWFSDTIQQLDYHGFADGLPEEFYVSPCCRYSFSNSYICAQCDALISEEQSLYGLCAKCEAAALERFKYFLLNDFTDRERAYIDACIEGVGITDSDKIKPVLAG